jgi:hypothetical protein
VLWRYLKATLIGGLLGYAFLAVPYLSLLLSNQWETAEGVSRIEYPPKLQAQGQIVLFEKYVLSWARFWLHSDDVAFRFLAAGGALLGSTVVLIADQRKSRKARQEPTVS